MRFTDRPDEEVHINLTPLIDVVFLLVIFFMVSTTFSKESELRIRLPEATAEAPEQQDRMLRIEINADGVYAVKGPQDEAARRLINTQAETLRQAVRSAAGGDDEVVVVIRADRRTPHESVVRAMDVARRLGLLRITFSTQQSTPSAETP